MIGFQLKFFYIALPLLFALSLTQDFDVHVSRLIVLTIFAIYIVQGLYRRSLYIPKGSVVIIGSTILLWTICSLFYSEVISWSARKIFFLLTFAPLCLVSIWYLMRQGDSEKKLVEAVVLGGFVGSVVAIVQFLLQFAIGLEKVEKLWITLTPFFLGGSFSQSVAAFNSWFVHVGSVDIFRAIGFFPDPHVFAFYTGMIAPFAFGLYAKSHSKIWLLVGFVTIIANLLSFSRGSQMGLLSGLIVAILMIWPSLTTIKRHAVTGACALMLLIAVFPGNSLSDRFASSFSRQDTSNTSRIDIWSEALELITQSPIIGVGLGAYAYNVDPEASYRTPAYAHNIFLDISSELGLIGLLLFLLLIIRMMWIFINRDSAMSRCAIISMCIFLVHGLFDTPIFSVHVFPVILFLIALAAYYEGISSLNQEKTT